MNVDSLTYDIYSYVGTIYIIWVVSTWIKYMF